MKEFNILEQKALAFYEDRLPVVFKYNGETLRKLSAITKNISGENSVGYTSEYNRSLRNLSITGNTLQDGTPTPDIPIPIENANVDGVNIFTTDNATVGYFQSSSTGNLSSNASYNTTDHIEVEPNTTYNLSFTANTGTTWANTTLCAYDTNYNFLGALSGYAVTSAGFKSVDFKTIFDGIKYIRLSYHSNCADISIVKIMQVTLHGNNLFSPKGVVRSLSGIFKFTENSLTLNSIASGAAHYIVYSRLYPAGTYYFSYKREVTSGTSTNFLVSQNSAGGTFNSYYGMSILNCLPNQVYTLTSKKPFQIGFSFGGDASVVGKSAKLYDIMLSNVNIAYEPYWEETIDIPTSVTYTDVEGTSKTVPLLFTEWDKLTVDRVKNEVIYTEGSWFRKFTGRENWLRNGYAHTNGYGTYYIVWLGHHNCNGIVNNVGYSSHFKTVKPAHPAPYNSVSFVDSINVQICTDRETPLDDFKLWLQQKYAEGDPVVALAKRSASDTRTHDITDTDLGNLILDLTNKVPYGTIYLEVNSGLSVPITVDYAKWGGANE